MRLCCVLTDRKVILEANIKKKSFAQMSKCMLSASERLYFFSLSAQWRESQFLKPWERVPEITYTKHFVKFREL